MVAPASPSPEPIRAVLVYQAAELTPALQDALLVAGVQISHATKADALVQGQFGELEPQVFLINLDPELEDHLDDVTDMLARFDRPVIFNESSASNSLSGWDQSRWARHLAAKIKGEVDSHPPRPPDAPTIAVPARKLVPVPQPTTIAQAVAPVAPAVVAPAPIVAPVAPSAIAGMPPQAAASLDVAPVPAPRPLAPTLELPAVPAPKRFAEAVAEPALDVDATLAALFGEVPLNAPTVAVSAKVDPVSPKGAELPFDFEVDSFESIEVTGVTLDTAVAANAGTEPAAELDGLFDLDVGSDENASSLSEAGFAELDLDFDTRSAAPADGLTDLDELFRQAQPAAESTPREPAKPVSPVVAVPGPAVPAEAKQSTPEPAKPREFKPAPMEWSLEPLDGEGLAAPVPQGRAQYQLGKDVPRVDVVPPPAQATKPAQTEAEADLAAFDFFFEPDSTAEAPTASTPVVASTPSPAAMVPSVAAAPATDFAGLDDFNFDLGIDANYAPGQSDSSDAVVADLDGLFADLDAPAVSSAIPGLDRVWILGASIGGPEAVRAFLERLNAKVGAGFIVAQHMGAEFLELMISQLAKASPLPVRLAQSGMELRNGEVLVAPVGKRLTLDGLGKIELGTLASDSPYSPSIDQIMLDVSDRMGNRCSAILFSGMASDAIEGSKYICSKGGRIWVQDPSTCVISSMIDGAQAAGVVSYVGSPEQLAEHLLAQQA